MVFSFQHGDRPAPNVKGSRSPVLGMNGMVATSQPLASAAALRVLQDGGNAVDAAITAAAVLNVVEPMMTGIGGDMFALVYMQQDGKPAGLNGSGWAGSKATLDFFNSRHILDMPSSGMHAVSVPGAVAGWYKLHGKYGKLPMSRILAPAIEYAEKGFPVSDIIAAQWQRSEPALRRTPDAARDLLVDGRTPRHGEVFKMPELARTLKRIAGGGRDVFYKGEIAKKLAFADRDAYIADPDKVRVPVSRLISKDYAAERRKLIDKNRAMPVAKPGITENGDTVYLTVVDKDRNAVSFINSLFASFGSGLVAGDTGIVLHNRGALFQLDGKHPNVIAPRKRPFHTLIPAMVLKEGKPFFSFGVMGGDMQPQGHVQVLVNLIDFGMDAQQAGEAPRFRHGNGSVALESAFAVDVRSGLTRKGHNLIDAIDAWGGYQGILIDPRTGVLIGGSDPRKDGLAIGW